MNQEPAAISNEVLQGKDSLLYLVAENTSDVIWVMNIDGTCSYVSPSIKAFAGYTVEEFVSMHLEEYLAPDSLEKIRTLLLEELTRKRMPGAEDSTHTIDLEFLCRDGSRKWGEVRVRPVCDKTGRLCKIVGVTRDATDRFLADQEREAMLELHRLAGEHADLRSLMQGVTAYLKDWSGCDAIGIRLRDGEDFPYYETMGFSLSFVMAENRLCSADEKGEILRDSTGNPVIECMCGNILCGRFDPSKPFFTPRGSFWTNSTTELLASTTEADRLTRTRNRCHTQGYESLALVPLRCQGEIFGLLQFNDRRIGRFTKEKIALLERLADTLAAALAQRKTREAIEESELRFRTVADNTYDWEFWQRPDGTFEYISPSCKRITGIDACEFLNDPGLLLSVIHPEDREFYEQHIVEEQQAKNCDEILFRIVAPDGSHRWVGHTCQPVFGETGRFLGVRGSNRDVTERKLQDKQLIFTENRFRKLFNGMTSGVAIYQTVDDGADFKFIDMNEAGLRICATTKDKLFGRTVSEIFPAVRLTGIFDAFRKAWQTGEPQYCPVTLYDDGRIGFWVENRVYRLPNGEIVTVFDDVTRRKEAEEHFRSSEEKFHKVFMATPDLVAITTMEDGLYLEINDSFCRVMGFEREEIIGKTSIELGLWIDPDDRRQAIAELLKTGHIQNREVLVRTKSGEPRFFLISGEEIQLFGKRCLITIAKDLTDRKRVEESLSKSENRYRRLFEDAALGIFQSTPDGKIITVNPAYAEMFGYDSIDDLMASVRDIAADLYADPSCRPDVVAMILERDGTVQVENLYRRKDGSTFTGMLHAWALKDEKAEIIRLEGFVEDTSARKAAEDALKNQNRFLQTLIDAIPIPVFFKDREGVYRGCNKACEVLWGPREQMIGKTVYDVSPKELADVYFKADLELFNNPGIQVYETVAADRNGETRNVIFNKATYMDGNGHVAGLIGAIIDITKRKQAEEALQDSKAKLDLALWSAGMGTWYWDVAADRRHFDGQVCRLLGLNTATFTGTAEEFFGTVHRDDREKLRTAMNRTLEQDLLYEPEYRVVWSDGSIHHIAARGRLVRDGEDRPVRINGIIWDITNGKKLEEELLESEFRFRNLVESAPDGIFVQTKGLIRYLNKAVLCILGAESQDQLIGQPFIDSIHPEFREGVKARARIITEEKERVPVQDQVYLRLDGTPVDVAVSVVPIHYDGEAGALVFLHDITERKKARRALAKSEEQYRHLFENAIEGMFRSTVEGRYVQVNPALAKIFGYGSPEEMIEQVTDIGRQLYVDPNERARCLRILEEQDALRRFEVQMRRRDEACIWTVINSRVVRDDAGKALYIEGMISDITELKRAEEALRESERRLRQAQKMEAIGTLAGGIAHDFNNILAAVIGYTEMSLCNNMTKKQIVANLQQVLTAGLRAKDLIKQILTFSRQSEHEHNPVRIDSMIKEAVKMLRASLPVTIRIRQNIRVDMGAIIADPTQIHQVVMNLATNAAHAMRAEGGVLGIELAEVTLGERDAEVIHADLHAGQYLRLTVSDTGHGIDSAILHRIFDPFFTTKEQGEGTGMGLAVVHGIVKNHDGVITVESEPGQGTTFEIYFPMIQSEAVTAEALQVGLPSGKGRGRLLFVDDEEALALLGMQLLTRIGYKVVTFTNSIDALEAFMADPQGFDAVITDQTMPRLTGLDLAKQMLQIRPDIPIILCTGFSEAVTPEKAKSIGIREFLMKPLVMQQMADVISGIFKEQG